jgi:hypothetical protein
LKEQRAERSFHFSIENSCRFKAIDPFRNVSPDLSTQTANTFASLVRGGAV